MTWKSLVLGSFVVVSLIVLSGLNFEVHGQQTKSLPKNGISGLAQVVDSTYLAVHDWKDNEEGKKGIRLSLIKTYHDKDPTYHPVIMKKFKSEDNVSNDLEAICKIPNRENEYLLLESGDFDDKYARIFRIKLDANAKVATVTNRRKYKIGVKRNRTQDGDENEGLICAKADNENLLLVFGERGGSSAHSKGFLKFAEYNLTDFSDTEMTFIAQEKLTSKTVPGVWSDPDKNRDISDLYLDDNNMIWASAAEDQGDAGPLYSVIYQLGKLNTEEPYITFCEELEVYWEIAGFKIEALSGPSAAIMKDGKPIAHLMSFGTDDENYGGVWRVLKERKDSDAPICIEEKG